MTNDTATNTDLTYADTLRKSADAMYLRLIRGTPRQTGPKARNVTARPGGPGRWSVPLFRAP